MTPHTWQAAAQAFDTGNLDVAERLCRQALGADPQHPDSQFLLGQICMARGQYHEASVIFKGLHQRYPKDPTIGFALAESYRAQGQRALAKKYYERLLKGQPVNIPVLGNLGLLAFEDGNFSGAENYFKRILKLDERHVDTWLNLGNVHREQGDRASAMDCYRRVIQLAPAFVGGYNNLGNLLLEAGQAEDAARCFQHALGLAPDHSRLWENLADAQRDMLCLEEAQCAYERALALDELNFPARYKFALLLLDRHQPAPALHQLVALISGKQEAKYWVAMAKAYLDLALLRPASGKAYEICDITLSNLPADTIHALTRRKLFECAIHCCDQALAICAEDIGALDNRGLALTGFGRLEAARDCFKKANALAPDYAQAHFNLGFSYLLAGQWTVGFKEYAWRVKMTDSLKYLRDYPMLPPPLEVYRLERIPDLTQQRVLVVYDQGLGDELFFLAFLPALRQRVGWLGYWPNKKLVPLLKVVLDVDRLVSVEAPPETVDVVIPVSDLPAIVGVDPNHFPEPIRLAPSAEAMHAVRDALGDSIGRPLLGLTWRAGPAPAAGVHHVLAKHIPIELLADAIHDWPGDVIVTQRGPTPEELALLTQRLGRPVVNLSEMNEDLDKMLAVLSLLSEYVAVSNTNVYLRNSLHRPCRILVPHPPEWRWMTEGEHVPCFPHFKVYREHLDAGWHPALNVLKQDLAARGSTHGED